MSRLLVGAALTLCLCVGSQAFCCDGPPDAFSNPLGLQGLNKFTISVADAAKTSAFFELVLGFRAVSKAVPSPFGAVSTLEFETLKLELIEAPGSIAGPLRPAPPNHTYYQGFTQWSFRVQNREVISSAMSDAGIPILLEFANDQLQLYLQIVREPTTGTLMEFLQPYDNSSSSVNWSTNPLGLLGFNQATVSVSALEDSAAWYRTNFGMLTPYTTFMNLLKLFGTELGIAYAGRLRVEQIYQADSVPYPNPAPNPPHQAAVQNLVSYGVRVANLSTTLAALSNTKVPVLYHLSGQEWQDGLSSAWVRDPVSDTLIEFVGPE